MKEFMCQRIDTAFGIAVICLFSSIYLSIGYQVIHNYLSQEVGFERLLVRR